MVIYKEGHRREHEAGKAWVHLTSYDSYFDDTGYLYPLYILKWSVSGQPVDDYGEFGPELRPTIATKGIEILEAENDAQAIRLAIAKYDELSKWTKNSLPILLTK